MGSNMITKKVFRLSGFAITALLACGLFAGNASADTYNVNASVPYEAPTQAATINHVDGGAAVEDVQQTITGTCQIQNPTTVVSIWRDGVVLGSVPCVSGSFSVQVILQIGQNSLVAKTANASGIYGPDSTKRTYVVKQPVVVEPLPPEVNQPTTTESHQAATNQGGISGLTLTTEAPFDILPATKQATIRVVVGGGQQPYTLQLKWGDGSTESHSLTEPGTYEFLHTYLVQKTYSVYANVRDVLGAYSEFVFAVVSGTKTTTNTSGSTSNSSSAQQTGPWRLAGVVWYIWLILLLGLCFLLYTYWLGYRRGMDRSEAEVERRVLAAQRKKKPKKK